MPVKFIPDDNDSDPDIPGVNRHFYEEQVGSASPFDDTWAFRVATARAKDEARHKLIKAVQEADQQARYNSFAGFGNDSLTESMSVTRSIDGDERAPLDSINL